MWPWHSTQDIYRYTCSHEPGGNKKVMMMMMMMMRMMMMMMMMMMRRRRRRRRRRRNNAQTEETTNLNMSKSSSFTSAKMTASVNKRVSGTSPEG